MMIYMEQKLLSTGCLYDTSDVQCCRGQTASMA